MCVNSPRGCKNYQIFNDVLSDEGWDHEGLPGGFGKKNEWEDGGKQMNEEKGAGEFSKTRDEKK